MSQQLANNPIQLLQSQPLTVTQDSTVFLEVAMSSVWTHQQVAEPSQVG